MAKAIKPIFAAKNCVKSFNIYIFLAKDLVISKKSSNFAANLQISIQHGKQ
jgi:hypothetical protein